MDTASIKQLRIHRDEIRKSLQSIKVSQYTNQKYGNEKEYTAKGIVAGIDAILIDISTLTKAAAKFIQKSALTERKQLVEQLGRMKSHVVNKDFQNLALTIDQIKPLLRNIGVRQTDERKDVFDEYIDSLQKKSSKLDQHISHATAISLEIDKLKEDIYNSKQKLLRKLEELETKGESFKDLTKSTQESRSELESMLTEDQTRSKKIEELLVTSKSHSEAIDNFSKRIAKRESQLEDQEITTDKYKETLSGFVNEHEKHLSTANKLIESAKLALEYKTAEGLSAAFTTQYDRADNILSKLGWIASAGLFVAASVCVGVWVAWEQDIQLPAVVSRISLLPILLGGAWFSAGQYVKQKNIAEDYAYKSVLAKSIVGFSDQLSTDEGIGKGENYSHFMKSVLLQIHNDPLRKHVLKPLEENSESVDMKKVLVEIKGLKKIIETLDKYTKNGKE